MVEDLELKKCPSKDHHLDATPLSYEEAGSRIRTDDLLITNQLLYQLSYAGIYSVSDVIAQFPSC